MAGRLTKGEATIEFNGRIQTAKDMLDVEKAKASIRSLGELDKTGVKDSGCMEGGFLYVLFTESKVFCAKVHGAGSTSFEFCGGPFSRARFWCGEANCVNSRSSE